MLFHLSSRLTCVDGVSRQTYLHDREARRPTILSKSHPPKDRAPVQTCSVRESTRRRYPCPAVPTHHPHQSSPLLARASASMCSWRKTIRTTQGREFREDSRDSGADQRRNHQVTQQTR